MKDLGTKRKDDLYPAMVEESNKIDYPIVAFPRSLFPDKLDLDEIVELKIKVKITGIVKNSFRDEVDVSVTEGELVTK